MTIPCEIELVLVQFCGHDGGGVGGVGSVRLYLARYLVRGEAQS
jgi:hypothetical protein